jgi:hypothetical protein
MDWVTVDGLVVEIHFPKPLCRDWQVSGLLKQPEKFRAWSCSTIRARSDRAKVI